MTNDEKEKMKDKLAVGEEIARIAPMVNRYLDAVKGVQNPQIPNLNRAKARELGFTSATEIKNNALKEQARQEIVELGKSIEIDKHFQGELGKLLPEWLMKWAGKSRWRLKMLGIRLAVQESFDLKENCPISICRVYWFGKERAAASLGWRDHD